MVAWVYVCAYMLRVCWTFPLRTNYETISCHLHSNPPRNISSKHFYKMIFYFEHQEQCLIRQLRDFANFKTLRPVGSDKETIVKCLHASISPSFCVSNLAFCLNMNRKISWAESQTYLHLTLGLTHTYLNTLLDARTHTHTHTHTRTNNCALHPGVEMQMVLHEPLTYPCHCGSVHSTWSPA